MPRKLDYVTGSCSKKKKSRIERSMHFLAWLNGFAERTLQGETDLCATRCI